MKKICFITGTRAEFWLLKPIILEIIKSKNIEIQLIVTGSHLSNYHGKTIQSIKDLGIVINKEIEIILASDSDVAILKSMGLALISFSEALNELRPDNVVILGDRYEAFCAATACYLLKIPISHIHGGEVTLGAYDDSLRHSISKFAHFHFAATLEYSKRIIQLGEDPNYVFVSGAPGIDNVLGSKKFSRNEIHKKFGITFNRRNLLVTYHPETLDSKKTEDGINELLLALDEFEETNIFFSQPNVDSDNHKILLKIQNFIGNYSKGKAYLIPSFGQYYFSMVHFVDAVVGNSSSGIIEIPSCNKPTVNIGSRQDGRVKATSVIDCSYSRDSIVQAIKTATGERMKKLLPNIVNPYGSGGASKFIAEKLIEVSSTSKYNKKFHDIYR